MLDYFLGARMVVDFTTRRGKVIDYTVVLLFKTRAGAETVRVYDSAHGYNEMHRYTRTSGKQTGTIFHSGSLGEGMRAAVTDVKNGFAEMIKGWQR